MKLPDPLVLNRSKPCWALVCKGRYFGATKLNLVEYAFSDGAWWPTGRWKPVAAQFKRALLSADIIGVPKPCGRKRRKDISELAGHPHAPR